MAPGALTQTGARFRLLPIFQERRAAVTTTVWGPALVALLLHALLVVIFLARNEGDASALICAASYRIGQPPYEAITRAMGPSGEDGQFYYSLARSPWRAHGRS